MNGCTVKGDTVSGVVLLFIKNYDDSDDGDDEASDINVSAHAETNQKATELKKQRKQARSSFSRFSLHSE